MTDEKELDALKQKFLQELSGYVLLKRDNLNVTDPAAVMEKLMTEAREIFAASPVEEPKKRRTGYERAEPDGEYFFTNVRRENGIEADEDNGASVDTTYYNSAIYYTDEQLAKDCARADTLMRKLRRFSAEHRSRELNPYSSDVFAIRAGEYLGDFNIEPRTTSGLFWAGDVLFDTEEHCQMAIDEFHGELMWYFTQFKDTAEVFD